jgi:hypothetical protein
MSDVTFHSLCRARAQARMIEDGLDEDGLAAMLAERFGAPWTGDDLRAMAREGYPSTLIDMMAEARGANAVTVIINAVQSLLPGPHINCPTCSCGITYAQRRQLAITFVEEGTEHLVADIQRMRAEAGRGPQSETCCPHGLSQETA